LSPQPGRCTTCTSPLPRQASLGVGSRAGSPVPMYLRGVEEHLIMHLDLPQDPRDLGVGHGHEHHVMDSEKWHQHQRGLEQLPERRNTLSRQPGAATSLQPPCSRW